MLSPTQKLLVTALAVVTALAGLAVVYASPAYANPAADSCSEVHQFGATPVPVAKTADGTAVLAHVEWGYETSIGCYLSLDQDATATLQASGVAITLPTGPPDATALRCSEVHQFGATPVPAAKTADGTAVLAYLRWLPKRHRGLLPRARQPSHRRAAHQHPPTPTRARTRTPVPSPVSRCLALVRHRRRRSH